VKHAVDHLVLCVNDLERARGFYARLGFTLTPRAQHPFGTANHLVQMQGSFLEILGVADRTQIPAAAPGAFSFGAFNAEFLSRREGFSMLVFQSEDAHGGQRAFATRGLDTYAPFDFSRRALLPDGSAVTVAFSLAFVTHPAMPEAAFFTCQQHAPQYFWKPEYQRHANGAAAIVEVVMAAEYPAGFADFFGRLVDPKAVATEGNCLRIGLSGGAITVLDRDRLRAWSPEAEVRPSPAFAGYAVAVRDLDAAEAILRRAELPYRKRSGGLQIVPGDAFGTVIEFRAAQENDAAPMPTGGTPK
jgi:catechol 2,3-dioxygenase-like lactoylglutathione lyase family enzyme